MDVVVVMATYLPVMRFCTAQSREALESASLDCVLIVIDARYKHEDTLSQLMFAFHSTTYKPNICRRKRVL